MLDSLLNGDPYWTGARVLDERSYVAAGIPALDLSYSYETNIFKWFLASDSMVTSTMRVQQKYSYYIVYHYIFSETKIYIKTKTRDDAIRGESNTKHWT